MFIDSYNEEGLIDLDGRVYPESGGALDGDGWMWMKQRQRHGKYFKDLKRSGRSDFGDGWIGSDRLWVSTEGGTQYDRADWRKEKWP